MLEYNFVATQPKFIIAKLSVRKLGYYELIYGSKAGFAIINLRGVSTKLYFNLIFSMQTYKELITLYVIAQTGDIANKNCFVLNRRIE